MWMSDWIYKGATSFLPGGAKMRRGPRGRGLGGEKRAEARKYEKKIDLDQTNIQYSVLALWARGPLSRLGGGLEPPSPP